MTRRLAALCLSLALCPAPYGSAAAATPAPAMRAPEREIAIAREGSMVEFRASATFAKVVGVFQVWNVTFKLNSDTLADSALDLKIAAESVHTGSGFKDKEVKGKNFFNVKEFPEIRFVSTGVLPDPNPQKFTMTGNLTLRGITRPVTVAFDVDNGPDKLQKLKGNFTFNRRDFGMTHNLPFNKVADVIQVEIELQLPPGALTAAGASTPTT
jgi:polyisoprenoid-binding protein YceI